MTVSPAAQRDAASTAGTKGQTRGLTSQQAAERLRRFGRNELREGRPPSRSGILLRQISSPLLLLLLFAAVIAAAGGELADGLIVFTILAASAAIGYLPFASVLEFVPIPACRFQPR